MSTERKDAGDALTCGGRKEGGTKTRGPHHGRTGEASSGMCLVQALGGFVLMMTAREAWRPFLASNPPGG